MKKSIFVGAILATIGLGTSVAHASAGTVGGGGGNVRESDLRYFIGMIDTYFQSEEGKQTFPEIVAFDASHPSEDSLHNIMNRVHPVVGDGQVQDSFQDDRDCVAEIGNLATPTFQCNGKALPSMTLENYPSLYRIVLHELFVITGIEKPISKAIPSDYSLSYRITANVHLETFQAWVPGKKLPLVMPKDMSSLCHHLLTKDEAISALASVDQQIEIEISPINTRLNDLKAAREQMVQNALKQKDACNGDEDCVESVHQLLENFINTNDSQTKTLQDQLASVKDAHVSDLACITNARWAQKYAETLKTFPDTAVESVDAGFFQTAEQVNAFIDRYAKGDSVDPSAAKGSVGIRLSYRDAEEEDNLIILLINPEVYMGPNPYMHYSPNQIYTKFHDHISQDSYWNISDFSKVPQIYRAKDWLSNSYALFPNSNWHLDPANTPLNWQTDYIVPLVINDSTIMFKE